MKNIRIIICILAIAMVTAGCAGGRNQGGELFISANEEAGDAGEEAGPAGLGTQSAGRGSVSTEEGVADVAEGVADAAASAGTHEALIYVQVSGAVKEPGVYALPEGSRVFQAIELAGGVSAEADAQSLNQARPLEDGEMVYVLTAEEAAQASQDQAAQAGAQEQGVPGGQEPSADDGKVNLNTATREELMQLPGIGEAKAERILAWREENGGFAQVEDLMKIEGIKEGVFSKVEDRVRVQ